MNDSSAVPRKVGSLIRRWHKAALLVATVLVVASIGLSVPNVLKPYIDSPYRDLTGDIDWGCLNKGLDRIHGFSDTGRWWTGTWCGEVPFWRPLTSYVFWGMRLLWPKEYMLPREIILVALHLLFVGVAGLLLWRLTRRPWLVLTAMWFFAGIRPAFLPFYEGTPQIIWLLLMDPKNIPDPLAGIAIASSLLFLTGGRWTAALIAAAVGVGFKEIGFTVWPLSLLVLAWIHRDRILAPGGFAFTVGAVKRNWKPVSAWMIVLFLLAGIHYLAVGVGYRLGSNQMRWVRTILYLGGPIAANLFSINRAAVVIAGLVLVVMVSLRRFSVVLRFAGILVVVSIGIMLDSYLLGTTWDISMVRVLEPSLLLRDIVLSLVWLALLWEVRHDWRTFLFGFTMCAVATGPTWMAAQTQYHTLYIASLFMALAVAAALCRGATALANVFGIQTEGLIKHEQ